MKNHAFIFSFALMLLLAKAAIFPGVNAQVWFDDLTDSSRIDSSENVLFTNSLVTLKPHQGSSSQQPGFQWTLSGKDWDWPSNVRIESAEDIDARDFLGSTLYLVADAAGKKVIEYNATNEVVSWEFYGETVTDPRYLGKPVAVHSYPEQEGNESVRKILIADEGRHRVLKVIQSTKDIQWSYGTPDIEGIGPGFLSNPSDAVPMPDSNKIFICDKGNRRIILVDEKTNAIVWSYSSGLNSPVDIDYDSNSGGLLVTDQANHYVFIINVASNTVTWTFGTPGIPDSLSAGLNFPSDADFLPNGDILICDAGNHRLIEVNGNGNVVWDFGKRFENLKDADRLSDNKHVIIDGNVPSRVGYTTAKFVSPPIDIGKEVSFLSLYWDATTLFGVTDVQLQLRTENTLGDLESADWMGPTEQDSFYVSPFTAINPVHNGHRFYQFRAKLITTNPLYTPVLNDVILNYFYYDVNTTGKIVSSVIQDTANYIVTRWTNLFFNTVLPEIPETRNKVELKITVKDAVTKEPLRSFTASNVDTANAEALSTIVGLENKQAIYLQASFKTNNSSVSPALDFWKVEWEHTLSSISKISFVNADFEDVSTYRFSDRIQPGQPYIDRITILLLDPNVEQAHNTVDVDIVSTLSLDHETVTLNRQTSGGFLLQPSIPGIILQTGTPIRDNGFLEVVDRDTLIVTYQDPTNLNDVSRDSVLIIENKLGSIYFTDANAVPVDTVGENDTIYVHVVGEFDRNITSAQDTIQLRIVNTTTSDRETVTLVELPDTSGLYNTGEFFSVKGYPLDLKNVGILEDGRIQALGNDQIGIEYDDSILPPPVLIFRTETKPPEDITNENSGPLDFDIAPNPYVLDSGNPIQFRASSSIGDMRIEKIEIYTLAGEKIREISESQLSIYYNYPIKKLEYGFAKSWWDFKNSSGDLVSSGTYFVKIYTRIEGTGKRLSRIKKLVFVK